MIVVLLFIAGVYMGSCPVNRWYITVVTWALVVCLIYIPSGLGPAALMLWVYISLVPMLQLYTVHYLNEIKITVLSERFYSVQIL